MQANFVNKSQVHHANANLDQVPQMKRQSSQPIPIKTIDQDTSYDKSPGSDSEYYDHQTWQMYHRIYEARRLRAHVIQSSARFDEYCIVKMRSLKSTMQRPSQTNKATEKEDHARRASISSISSREELEEDDLSEIFVLEMSK